MDKLVKWSITTVNTLRECNRKYFFAHVLRSKSFKNKLGRKAYVLKRMQNFSMWPGNVVDKIMEKTVIPMIQKKQQIDYGQVADAAIELAKRQFNFSKLQLYNDSDLTTSEVGDEWCVLEVHEIGKPFSEKELEDVYSKIRTSILNIPTMKLPGSEKQ